MSEPTAVFAVAYTPAPAGESPNLRAADQSAASSYYDAMEATFATCRKWSPGAALVLVTDVHPPGRAAERLSALGVSILPTEFAHRPAIAFGRTFNASLFSLDAMAALSRVFPDHPNILLDPDCLVVGRLEPLVERARRRFCALPTGFPAHEDANGLTALQASELHALLDSSLVGLPVHYGGECYAFTGETLAPVLARAEDAYALSVARAGNGEPLFTTEEHLMNYALRTADVDEIDDLVRRIWTAPTYRYVYGDEHRLAIWHLPAEKDRGIPGLLSAIRDDSSWFWSSDGLEFRARVGRIVGVGRRSLGRWGYDNAGRLTRRLTLSLGSRTRANRARSR